MYYARKSVHFVASWQLQKTSIDCF